MLKLSDRARVLGAGIFSMILTMGVARFAYTPLLPVMQRQAGLGVAEAGWLAALNYAGYLSGAIIASLVADLILKDRLYRIGMVMAVATTIMMGLSDNTIVWAISRYLAGLSTPPACCSAPVWYSTGSSATTIAPSWASISRASGSASPASRSRSRS